MFENEDNFGIPIHDISDLKTGDVLVCTVDYLTGFTKSHKYTIKGFYNNEYGNDKRGGMLINDKGREVWFSADALVGDFVLKKSEQCIAFKEKIKNIDWEERQWQATLQIFNSGQDITSETAIRWAKELISAYKEEFISYKNKPKI